MPRTNLAFLNLDCSARDLIEPEIGLPAAGALLLPEDLDIGLDCLDCSGSLPGFLSDIFLAHTQGLELAYPLGNSGSAMIPMLVLLIFALDRVARATATMRDNRLHEVDSVSVDKGNPIK